MHHTASEMLRLCFLASSLKCQKTGKMQGHDEQGHLHPRNQPCSFPLLIPIYDPKIL